MNRVCKLKWVFEFHLFTEIMCCILLMFVILTCSIRRFVTVKFETRIIGARKIRTLVT